MAEKFLAGDNPASLPGQAEAPLPAVGGDMQKVVYDTNDDGKVNSAEHADNAGHADTATVADDLTDVSPGNNHYYGTDAFGNQGWWPLPAGGGGGSGEANTTSNEGTGDGLAMAKVGVNLPFKTLKAGTNITLTPSVNEILISASGGAGLIDGDYGDITVGGSGTTMTIDNNVVTNAKLADVPTATIKGRTTAGTGDPEDLTAAQATALLNTFTSVDKGLAPASGGGTANFLRADGTWAAPAGGGGLPTAASICLLSTRATGQTFTYAANTARQLTLSTEIIDAANAYNTSTGRYMPNVAGYYAVYGVAQGPTNTNVAVALIYKNGAVAATGTYTNSAAAGQRMDVYAVIQMNGTTDYLELWGFSTVAGTTASADGEYTQLYAYLIAT